MPLTVFTLELSGFRVIDRGSVKGQFDPGDEIRLYGDKFRPGDAFYYTVYSAEDKSCFQQAEKGLMDAIRNGYGSYNCNGRTILIFNNKLQEKSRREALKLTEQAIDEVREIESPVDQIYALDNLAKALAYLGMAATKFDEILNLADELISGAQSADVGETSLGYILANMALYTCGYQWPSGLRQPLIQKLISGVEEIEDEGARRTSYMRIRDVLYCRNIGRADVAVEMGNGLFPKVIKELDLIDGLRDGHYMSLSLFFENSTGVCEMMKDLKGVYAPECNMLAEKLGTLVEILKKNPAAKFLANMGKVGNGLPTKEEFFALHVVDYMISSLLLGKTSPDLSYGRMLMNVPFSLCLGYVRQAGEILNRPDFYKLDVQTVDDAVQILSELGKKHGFNATVFYSSIK